MTNGGRILSVTGLGETVAEARAAAYGGRGSNRRSRERAGVEDIALAAAEGMTVLAAPAHSAREFPGATPRLLPLQA